MSAIWKYFTRLSSDRNKARCDTCKKELACTGGTTTCLSNHLKGKHKDLHKNFENTSKPKKTCVLGRNEVGNNASQTRKRVVLTVKCTLAQTLPFLYY